MKNTPEEQMIRMLMDEASYWGNRSDRNLIRCQQLIQLFDDLHHAYTTKRKKPFIAMYKDFEIQEMKDEVLSIAEQLKKEEEKLLLFKNEKRQRPIP